MSNKTTTRGRTSNFTNDHNIIILNVLETFSAHSKDMKREIITKMVIDFGELFTYQQIYSRLRYLKTLSAPAQLLLLQREGEEEGEQQRQQQQQQREAEIEGEQQQQREGEEEEEQQRQQQRQRQQQQREAEEEGEQQRQRQQQQREAEEEEEQRRQQQRQRQQQQREAEEEEQQQRQQQRKREEEGKQQRQQQQREAEEEEEQQRQQQQQQREGEEEEEEQDQQQQRMPTSSCNSAFVHHQTEALSNDDSLSTSSSPLFNSSVTQFPDSNDSRICGTQPPNKVTTNSIQNQHNMSTNVFANIDPLVIEDLPQRVLNVFEHYDSSIVRRDAFYTDRIQNVSIIENYIRQELSIC